MFFTYQDGTCKDEYDYKIAESSATVQMLSGAQSGYMSIDFSGGPFGEDLTFEVVQKGQTGPALASTTVEISGYFAY